MATVETSIETALLTRAEALLLSPVLPVAWPNRDFKPPKAGYLRVTHHPNRSRRLFLGSTDPHHRMGLLQIDAFMPLNKGPAAATEAAGKIAEWFPADFPLTSGGVTVNVQKAPDVGPALATDTHWMVPVMIPYEAYA